MQVFRLPGAFDDTDLQTRPVKFARNRQTGRSAADNTQIAIDLVIVGKFSKVEEHSACPVKRCNGERIGLTVGQDPALDRDHAAIFKICLT